MHTVDSKFSGFTYFEDVWNYIIYKNKLTGITQGYIIRFNGTKKK